MAREPRLADALEKGCLDRIFHSCVSRPLGRHRIDLPIEQFMTPFLTSAQARNSSTVIGALSGSLMKQKYHCLQAKPSDGERGGWDPIKSPPATLAGTGARQLTQAEQADLFDLLLVMMHEAPPPMGKDWKEEIERRVAEMDRGEVPLQDFDEAMRSLRATL